MSLTYYSTPKMKQRTQHGWLGWKVEVNHSLIFGLLMGREPQRNARTGWKGHKGVEEFFVDFCRDYTTRRADSKPVPPPPTSLSMGGFLHHRTSPQQAPLCSLNKG